MIIKEHNQYKSNVYYCGCLIDQKVKQLYFILITSLKREKFYKNLSKVA